MATNTQAAPVDDHGLKLVLPGRSMPAGAGWEWIAQGWTLFARAPLMWILSLFIFVVVGVVISLVPILGSLVFQVLQVVFAGGFVAACRSIEKTGEFELEHLFAGFSKRFVPLMLVGLLTLLGMIAIFLVFMAFVGMAILSAFMTGDPNMAVNALMASMMQIALATLVSLALLVPLLAAYWFAPALVMMHDMAPGAAMKASFFACVRNIIPFLVNGLVLFVALLVAMVPFGLGLLVWFPVAIASVYVSYRQVFTDEA
jgi:uncharacterized membrane protein